MVNSNKRSLYISEQGVDHALFLGIPIDGLSESFSRKLLTRGFVYDQRVQDMLCFNGEFANEKAYVAVVSTPRSNTVWRVCAIIKYSGWYEIKNAYQRFKGLLTRKYEAPYYEEERFENPYYDGCGMELTAVSENCATFVSYFNIPNGEIELSIFPDDGNDGIMIAYEDDKNRLINDMEKDETAMDDL